MANQRKRISELPPLDVASLDTTFVLGISGSTTYKISINNLTSSLDGAFATDLVTETLSNTLDTKLSTSSFNQYTASAINGTISGSSQLTASFDQRYVVSGSITQTTWDNIVNKPADIISSSAQITSFGFISQSVDISSLNSFTSSQSTLNTAFTNGINARLQTSSFNDFSTSVDSRLIAATNEQSLTHLVTTSSFNEYTASQSTSSLVDRLNSIESVSGSWITESETGSFLTNLNGAISSSSQLTSSFDERYTLSGSIQNIELPSNLVSGSSQLTSSYDTRYALSSSLSSISSSFNSRFNGLVTTGSNTFSGSQIFSGSMTVTSGQVIASTITNNSSSLFLQSGSNLYVQNNGVVEITGSLNVSGSANFNVSVLSVGGRSGDEGGEINLAIPVTNTTLQNRVTTDVFQNRYRIFEGSNDAKGVYIDLSKAPAGVGGELLWKASGFVNAGDYVTLGNLKARIPTSGNRSLQVATISGTYSVVGSDVYSAGGAAGTSITSPLSITTTPTYLNAGLHFVAVGYTDTWIIMDYVAFIAWRITMVIGPSFNANLITIERLY